MIKNYLEPFYEDGELKRQTELYDQIFKTDREIESLSIKQKNLTVQISSLRHSDLELGETDQERQNRLDDLQNQLDEIESQTNTLHKQNRISIYEVNTIELKIRGRYLKQRGDSGVLQDCLDLIKNLEIGDVIIKGKELESLATMIETKTDDNGLKVDYQVKIDFDTLRLTDTVKFGFIIKNRIVDWYLDYFNDARTIFKIYKTIYDRTLELYPNGLTDKDKKNRYCIFDKAFFDLLQNEKNKEFEINLMTFKKDSDHRVLPMTPSLSAYNRALIMVGTEPNRQMTIDDLIESQKPNNYVTFTGLDDSPNGVKLVFNENDAKKDEIVFKIKNLETVLGGGEVVSKGFMMCLEQMNHLGYFKRSGVKASFTISVRDLIETGVYTSKPKSYKALQTIKQTLENLLVSMTNKKGLDLDIPWFVIGWKDTGTLIFVPDQRINWLAIGQHFTVYPPYLYKLGRHAYRLAFYVFTQARINKAPNEDGDIVFRLSLVNVSRELGLPDVNSIKKDYKKLILDKVTTAVREVLENDVEYYGDRATLKLQIESDANMTTREIIETGYLLVTFQKSEMTEVYQRLIESKHDVIESAKRKKAMKKRQERENK